MPVRDFLDGNHYCWKPFNSNATIGFDAADDCGWKITEVVSGGAIGVDSIGEAYALVKRLPVKRFIPDWNKFGRNAGLIRNAMMAAYADALVAIWDGQSRGTKNMIRLATLKHLKIFVAMAEEQPASTEGLKGTSKGGAGRGSDCEGEP